MVNIGAASATRPGQVGLDVSGLTVAYDGPPVLVDVSLGVDPGEIVALLGPSGSGKTTLLRSIAGLERPARGSVSLGERIVSDHRVFLAPERRRVGMVFQDGALFPHLDVSRNVAYGLPRAERSSDRVTAALRMVGLESMAHRMPGSLSGGQRQRVALARALNAARDLDGERRKWMTQVAIRHVQENFTLDKMCDSTLAVYYEVLAGEPPAASDR